MAPLLDQALTILTADGWSLMRAPDGGGLITTMAGELDWSVLVIADDEAGVLSCYSVLGESIPVTRRTSVMERLTRENYGQDLVTFEIDLDDGEVRCRSALALGRSGSRDVAAEALRAVVGRNVAAAEEIFPQLL